MNDRFILTMLGLQELEGFGYREVWIGRVDNPHWSGLPDDGIIASPRISRGGWPAIWSAEYFGKISCGNGMSKADQCQKSEVRNMAPGHYVLEDGVWKKIEAGKLCGD